MTGRMPTYASRARRATALAAMASALFVVLVALACTLVAPGQAHAYEYWYRVYDEDMNLLCDSTDFDAESPEIDVNDLQRGIYIECYYDGGDGNPLDGIDMQFDTDVLADGAGGKTSLREGVSWEDLDDDTRLVPKDGVDPEAAMNDITLCRMNQDENGYFIGVRHVLFHYSLNPIPADSEVCVDVRLASYKNGMTPRRKFEQMLFSLNVSYGEDEDADAPGEGEEPDDTEGEIVGEELIVGNDPDGGESEGDPIIGEGSEEEPEEDGTAEDGGGPGETEDLQSEEQPEDEGGTGEEPEESEETDDADDFEPSEDEAADKPAGDEWTVVQTDGSAGREDASESANRDSDGSDDVAGANQEKTPSDAWEPVGNVREDDDPVDSSREGDAVEDGGSPSGDDSEYSRDVVAGDEDDGASSSSQTSSSTDGDVASANRGANEQRGENAESASLADLGTVFSLAHAAAPVASSASGSAGAQIRLTGLSLGYVLVMSLFVLAVPIGCVGKMARVRMGVSVRSRLE